LLGHVDEPDGGLSPEDQELLLRYGGQPEPSAGEQPLNGVDTDQSDANGEPRQAQRQEPGSGQPAGEHPDNLPFLSLSTEEFQAELQRRLEEDPAELQTRLNNGTLRLTDYHRKTESVAEQRRQADALMAQAQEAQRQFQEQYSQPQQQGQPPAQPPPPTPLMDVETFASDFRAKHGREPTQADYFNYRVDAQVGARLEAAVDAKVTERTSKFEQTLMEREMEQIEGRAAAQYEELCREFPAAGDPSIKAELATILARMGSDLSGGDEMRRAYLFAHPELLNQAREEGLNGRLQQVERRESEAAPPPGNAGATVTTEVKPNSTNLDDIAAAQKKDPALMEKLVGLYNSMRGG